VRLLRWCFSSRALAIVRDVLIAVGFRVARRVLLGRDGAAVGRTRRRGGYGFITTLIADGRAGGRCCKRPAFAHPLNQRLLWAARAMLRWWRPVGPRDRFTTSPAALFQLHLLPWRGCWCAEPRSFSLRTRLHRVRPLVMDEISLRCRRARVSLWVGSRSRSVAAGWCGEDGEMVTSRVEMKEFTGK
jgi:hypothetical protein